MLRVARTDELHDIGAGCSLRWDVELEMVLSPGMQRTSPHTHRHHTHGEHQAQMRSDALRRRPACTTNREGVFVSGTA